MTIKRHNIHHGQCHCGAVKFKFKSAPLIDVTQCNCSVCSMSAYQHVFIPKVDLDFIQGEDDLTLYSFGTHEAKHYFCRFCGVKPLYHPRSHPDSWSVNLRCVEAGSLTVANTIEFDGQNWEKNIEDLRRET